LASARVEPPGHDQRDAHASSYSVVMSLPVGHALERVAHAL
jgi:hypothetical protein